MANARESITKDHRSFVQAHWSMLRTCVLKYTVRQRATLNSHHPLLSTIHKIHVF